MGRVTKAKFDKLADDEKLRIAKLEANRSVMEGNLAQLMPHSRLSDLYDSQWIELAECCFCPACRTLAT